MKWIAIRLCVAVVFALAAMAAQAQTCTGPLAQMISPPNGSILPAGAVTFDWCSANADYFLTVEDVPGSHDIFFAKVVGQTFVTLGPACAPAPPYGCIRPNGETIHVALWTQIHGVWQSPNLYTYTAASSTGAVAFSPTSLNLGSILVGGASGAQTVTLTNLGTGALTISAVTASGNFSETDTCSGQTLAPSATCDISVTFTPSIMGIIPGALTVSDNAPNSPQVVALSGKGLGSVSLSPASLSFGTVAVGTTSTPKTLTLTNNTAGALGYTFLASANYIAAGSGTHPCTGILAGKAKCTMSVAFTPTANGVANGSMAASSASFPTQLAGLSGTGSGGGTSPLTFSPATLNIGNTVTGTTSPVKTVTVTNASASPVNITNFVASGDYKVVGNGTAPCGGALGPGASCTVAVTFSPSVPGTLNGSVAFMDNTPVNMQIYNITGKAVLPVTFSPTSLTFAAQTVGTTSAQKTVTLTNNQAIALNLTSVVASGQYAAAAGGTKPCGSVVNAHSNCTLVVTFTPAQAGAIPGVITVTHDASGNPQVVKLSGTGQ
jgi:large repetitive protein